MTTKLAAGRRVALYVRVSTARQAEGELSIPDQIKQGQDFCSARGLSLVWSRPSSNPEPRPPMTNDLSSSG
jgi:site-specific DNA recombinase